MRFDWSGLFLALGGTEAACLGVKQDWAPLYDVGGALGGKVCVIVPYQALVPPVPCPHRSRTRHGGITAAVARVQAQPYGLCSCPCAVPCKTQS